MTSKKLLLGETTTFISISVVAIIVLISLYISSIDGKASLSSSMARRNRAEIKTMRSTMLQSNIERQKIMYDINEKLGIIEGEIKQISRRVK